MLAALLLDRLFGEPRRWHPLVGFGNLADWLERLLNRGEIRKARGVVAWLLAVGSVVCAFFLVDRWLRDHPPAWWAFSALTLYLALGYQSLLQHAREVSTPLHAGDLDTARAAVARIVSRETGRMNEEGVSRAAIESVLENGADAMLSALFWFALLGAPGVVLYRLANTLDAMWGYRNPRYLEFGWCAARIDDALNLVPAQLTALTYALLGKTRQAMRCWFHQGLHWKSLNAGSVMASGAGAIHVTVGGDETYHGVLQRRPWLGPDPGPTSRADAAALDRSIRLVTHSVYTWMAVLLLAGLASIYPGTG